ncbi:malate synthase A [Mongoliibacter ruber]|uniref:malate synthase n=1 Tax=Mongoliibacter ruber TaxID=1750599 RepID=A0A2T0WDQ9_9BACT|nr:malate synthase A [Mongoliibacter ruber]PRY84664.1 malate synthase [Mongoliibacter ruber]
MTIAITDHLKLQVSADISDEFARILTPEALEFLAYLELKFREKRYSILVKRQRQQERLDNGELSELLGELPSVSGDWQIAGVPEDLQDRRVEITGPVDRKMVINALNSGSKVFMADFEDASSPTWENMISGQVNLYDAIRRQIDYTADNGKTYSLADEIAVLKVRPRGWHLEEKHMSINGEPLSASIVDFGLYFFHNAQTLLSNGTGPYFYLAKLESHLEARLWNEVFVAAQDYMKIPQKSIKSTVLIETIFGALEMDNILFELKDHIVALNAGRWDYIFSIIKKFRNHENFILPDRGQVTMGVPFMKAYATKLVEVCHQRGAHAIGGMSAFIPAKDEKINQMARAKVKTDKEREAGLGYDGTWVAHPFLVDIAKEVFTKAFDLGQCNQKNKPLMLSGLESKDLLDVRIPESSITEEGVRTNINVGILYIESWLRGVGAAALYNLMEDAATAEISRAQLWQWIRHQVKMDNGQAVTAELYQELKLQEMEKIKSLIGDERANAPQLQQASQLMDKLVLGSTFIEFLTLPAYQLLD